MANPELIGSSPGFRAVLEKVDTVANAGCTVLLRGETGTGKEVVAHAIHDRSERRFNRFVALNCAAVPAALHESELFGHEKGAFTGAVSQSAGRFQAADRGTLFLGEIGDLPLELQPKLLRVLQEQQFERLGSGRTTQVDMRVIAATNQDLKRMVREHRFRADLYYRIEVFPIELPPLRDRKDDIPLLVEHFIAKYAERHRKPVPELPEDLVSAIQSHDWPGNIRELQNFVERAVVMASASAWQSLISDLQRRGFSYGPAQTLVDAEKAHIVTILQEANWVVGGRNGAAARLGLPRTTLISKMRKLGISRQRCETAPGTSNERVACASAGGQGDLDPAN